MSISPQATNDLEEICQFIGRDSIYYAKKFIKIFLHLILILDKYPKIGRIVPEKQNSNIREIIYRSYRIIYKIRENKVEILTVIHGSIR